MIKRLENTREEMAELTLSHERKDSYVKGFDAAVAELMPRIEKLLNSLKFYGYEIYSDDTLQGRDARENIAEWENWCNDDK